jgi:putative copper export protein
MQRSKQQFYSITSSSRSKKQQRSRHCYAETLGQIASLAGVGHTRIEEGWAAVLHVTADAAHLLAAGAWLGGLAPLGFILLGWAGTKPEARMPLKNSPSVRLDRRVR